MARRVIITPDQREEMIEIHVERLVERLSEQDLERYVSDLFIEQFEECTDAEVMETLFKSFRRKDDFYDTYAEVLDDHQMDQIAAGEYGEDADILAQDYDQSEQIAAANDAKWQKVELIDETDDDDSWWS